MSRKKSPKELGSSFENWGELSPREKINYFRKWKSDFTFFAKSFFPDWFPLPFAKFHLEIIDLLESGKSGVILVPREHGKTTLLNAYILWKLLFFRGELIIFIGSTQRHSKLRTIKQELESNSRILKVFGDLRGQTWMANEIALRNGNWIFGYSKASAVRGINISGRRPTRIIVDDLESDRDVSSPSTRRQIKDTFYKAIIPLSKEGQIVVVGTNLHYDSLINELAERKELEEMGWVKIRYQAILPDGSPLWPEKWPIEELEKKRQLLGEEAFASEFLNQPVPPSGAVFRRSDFQFYDTIPPSGRVVVAIDPATGKGADYTAIIRAIIYQGRAYITNCLNLKIRPQEIAHVIEKMRPINLILLEANNFQFLLADFLPSDIQVKSLKNTAAKEVRISSLPGYLQRGLILFPRQGCEALITQALHFPKGRNDDLLDALEFIARQVKSAKPIVAHLGNIRR